MTPALTLIPCEPIGTRVCTNAATGQPETLPEYDRTHGEELRTARLGRATYLRQSDAASLLGLTPREYTFLEGGRLTLSADDWQRVMEVIRG